MLTIGRKYFFKTLGHHYLGEVVAQNVTHAILKNASEVYDTGPLDSFYGKGVIKYSERVPDGWMVPLQGVCIGPWEHALPEQAVGL